MVLALVPNSKRFSPILASKLTSIMSPISNGISTFVSGLNLYCALQKDDSLHAAIPDQSQSRLPLHRTQPTDQTDCTRQAKRERAAGDGCGVYLCVTCVFVHVSICAPLRFFCLFSIFLGPAGAFFSLPSSQPVFRHNYQNGASVTGTKPRRTGQSCGLPPPRSCVPLFSCVKGPGLVVRCAVKFARFHRLLSGLSPRGPSVFCAPGVRTRWLVTLKRGVLEEMRRCTTTVSA